MGNPSRRNYIKFSKRKQTVHDTNHDCNNRPPAEQFNPVSVHVEDNLSQPSFSPSFYDILYATYSMYCGISVIG